MGCGCSSGRSGFSPTAYASTFSGTSAPGSGWSPLATSPQQEWEVTYPDGTTQVFDSDTEAYREVARSGGGIRQRDKVTV